MDDFEFATNKASAEKAGKASCLLTWQELTRKYREDLHCAVTVKLVKLLNRQAMAVKIIELVTSFTSSCV